VTAAVIALILVAALVLEAFYGGHLGGTMGSGSAGTTAPGLASSFYGSLPAANAMARASYWGWPLNGQPPLVFAEGLASPSELGALVNASHLGAVRCSPTVLSAPVPSLPTYVGALTAGLAPAWLFAFNPSVGTLLVLAVVNGTASLAATAASNGACYAGPGSFNTVAVDSTVAASIAGAASVSHTYFRAADANGTTVSAEYLLVPPGYVPHTPLAPMWVVNDTTCTLYGSPAVPGSNLTSIVNAATGALVSQTVVPVTC